MPYKNIAFIKTKCLKRVCSLKERDKNGRRKN